MLKSSLHCLPSSACFNPRLRPTREGECVLFVVLGLGCLALYFPHLFSCSFLEFIFFLSGLIFCCVGMYCIFIPVCLGWSDFLAVMNTQQYMEIQVSLWEGTEPLGCLPWSGVAGSYSRRNFNFWRTLLTDFYKKRPHTFHSTECSFDLTPSLLLQPCSVFILFIWWLVCTCGMILVFLYLNDCQAV